MTQPSAAARADGHRRLLTDLLRAERAQQRRLRAQHRAVQSLAEAGASIGFLLQQRDGAAGGAVRDPLAYHTLHELVLVAAPQPPPAKEEEEDTHSATDDARRGCLEAQRLIYVRLLDDAAALAPAHALLAGSLRPLSARLLLPRLMEALQFLGGGDRLPRALALSPSPSSPRLSGVCRSLARVLCFAAVLLEPGNHCLAAEVGPGMGEPSWTALRAPCRYLVVDLEEMRDVLLEEAARRRSTGQLWGSLPAALDADNKEANDTETEGVVESPSLSSESYPLPLTEVWRDLVRRDARAPATGGSRPPGSVSAAALVQLAERAERVRQLVEERILLDPAAAATV